MRINCYVSGFMVLVHATRDDAQAASGEVAIALAPMGLHLSEDRDEGRCLQRQY